MNESTIPDISSMFGGSDSSNVDVLVKFIESQDIEMKTIITSRQARAIFKLKWIYEISKPENYDKSAIEILMIVIDYYLRVVVSIDGKRVNSILSTLKEMKPQMEEKNLMEGIKK